MALIYVLQKDVKGLGQLTKVGMTVRSGDDRAKEYGGGGWECLKEYPVDVEDISELKQIETRVHEQLDEFKCNEAAGFGLTEVFTCSPNIAMAVVKDVIGSEPSLEDEAQRLKEKMSKGVASKIRKRYESALAKFNRDGYYAGGSSYRRDYKKYYGAPGSYMGKLQLCDQFLEELASSDDPVFRKMLEKERDDAIETLELHLKVSNEFEEKRKKKRAEERRKEKQLNEKERREAEEREAEVKRKKAALEEQRKQADLAAEMVERKNQVKKRRRDLILYVAIGLAFLFIIRFFDRF